MTDPHKKLSSMIRASKQIESPVLSMSKETAMKIFGYVVTEFEGITIRIDETLPLDNIYLKSKV